MNNLKYLRTIIPRAIIYCSLFIFHCSLINIAHGATLINDTEIESVLTELISPLARAAEIPDGRLRINLVNDNDFNAFVMGGEDLFIYTGLLTQIKSPDALQAVIAHEMGHMLGGHIAHMSARMAAEMKRSMIIQALGIGLALFGLQREVLHSGDILQGDVFRRVGFGDVQQREFGRLRGAGGRQQDGCSQCGRRQRRRYERRGGREDRFFHRLAVFFQTRR